MRQVFHTFFLLTAFLSLQEPVKAQPRTVRVLFLGNSYVSANNLPLLTRSLALSAGDTLIYAENTPGGYTFSDHLNDPLSLSRMAEPQWDYVILQQQSILGSAVCNEPYNIAPAAMEPNNVQSVTELKGLIDAEGGIPMLYMTWGRKNGLPVFATSFRNQVIIALIGEWIPCCSRITGKWPAPILIFRSVFHWRPSLPSGGGYAPIIRT